MRKLNNPIGGTTINMYKENYGVLYEEKIHDLFTVKKHLLYPAEEKPMYPPPEVKASKLNNIYLPIYEHIDEVPDFLKDLREMEYDRLVVDIRLVNEQILALPNIVLIADSNISGFYSTSLSKRKGKFKEVILVCRSKVNWTDIIYDWRELTDNLRIVISEQAMVESNLGGERNSMVGLYPPKDLESHFNLEIQLVVSSLTKDMYGKLIGNTNEYKILNNKWSDVLNEVRLSTPNVYMTNLDITDDQLICNYNHIDSFRVDGVPYLIVKGNPRQKRFNSSEVNFADLDFDPLTDILFDSIRDYNTIEKGKV